VSRVYEEDSEASPFVPVPPLRCWLLLPRVLLLNSRLGSFRRLLFVVEESLVVVAVVVVIVVVGSTAVNGSTMVTGPVALRCSNGVDSVLILSIVLLCRIELLTQLMDSGAVVVAGTQIEWYYLHVAHSRWSVSRSVMEIGLYFQFDLLIFVSNVRNDEGDYA
jgi:hypothetical protein